MHMEDLLMVKALLGVSVHMYTATSIVGITT